MLKEESQTKRYHTIWMHSDEILEKAQLNYGYKNINGWPDQGTGFIDCKEEWGSFRSNRNVLHLDYGDSYTDAYI